MGMYFYFSMLILKKIKIKLGKCVVWCVRKIFKKLTRNPTEIYISKLNKTFE